MYFGGTECATLLVCFMQLVCLLSTVPIVVVWLCYQSFTQLYTDMYISPLTYRYIGPQPTFCVAQKGHTRTCDDKYTAYSTIY